MASNGELCFSLKEFEASYIAGRSVCEAWCRTLIYSDYTEQYLKNEPGELKIGSCLYYKSLAMLCNNIA